ncbi:coagulation factor XII-like isoform X1 [Lampetra planeri]
MWTAVGLWMFPGLLSWLVSPGVCPQPQVQRSVLVAPPPAGVKQSTDGTAVCHFPFVYRNESHLECLQDTLGLQWCGITADLDSDRRWRYCARAPIALAGDDYNYQGNNDDYDDDEEDDSNVLNVLDHSSKDRPCKGMTCLFGGVCKVEVGRPGRNGTGAEPVCTCRPPFHGKNCHMVRNPCRRGTCHFRGACLFRLDDPARPKCRCQLGFWGSYCGKSESVTPSNSTSTVPPLGSPAWVANVSDPFPGSAVQRNPCVQPNPCLNGGACFVVRDKWQRSAVTCTCPSKFHGFHCNLREPRRARTCVCVHVRVCTCVCVRTCERVCERVCACRTVREWGVVVYRFPLTTNISGDYLNRSWSSIRSTQPQISTWCGVQTSPLGRQRRPGVVLTTHPLVCHVGLHRWSLTALAPNSLLRLHVGSLSLIHSEGRLLPREGLQLSWHHERHGGQEAVPSLELPAGSTAATQRVQRPGTGLWDRRPQLLPEPRWQHQALVLLYKQGQPQGRLGSLQAAAVPRKPAGSYLVRLGKRKLHTHESGEQDFNVSKVIVHPNYSEGTHDADIALLRLWGDAGECAHRTTVEVVPVCLPEATEPARPGTLCHISGWGTVGYHGATTPVLQEAEVPVVAMDACNSSLGYNGQLTAGMLCAGNWEQGGPDACKGDSGGPLTCAVQAAGGEESSVLHGIVSHGRGCGEKYRPGVYTRVSAFVTWIHSSMADNGTAATGSAAGGAAGSAQLAPRSSP